MATDFANPDATLEETSQTAAAYFRDRDVLFVMTEDVAVISDARVAERYGIGPYGDAELLE